MRILFAEDDRELSRAVRALLEHSGYSVDAVFNGRDAADYALQIVRVICQIYIANGIGKRQFNGCLIPVCQHDSCLVFFVKADCVKRIARIHGDANAVGFNEFREVPEAATT